jgi:hypothetical protein
MSNEEDSPRLNPFLTFPAGSDSGTGGNYAETFKCKIAIVQEVVKLEG